MSNMITLYTKNVPDRNFRWRDIYGEFHHPHKMETRHVYFTMQMIWNQAVPSRYRVNCKQLRSFPDFYTTEYMFTAFRAMFEELQTRNDMTPYMLKGFKAIEGYRDLLLNEVDVKLIPDFQAQEE